MKTIAVIIPTYNRRDSLMRALKSVMAQTHQPDEIIVVDDGSTDDTADIIKRDYPNIHYIYQTNQGVSAARNRGIAAAKSEWIAFLDSDDEWLPEKLCQQHHYMTTNVDCQLLHTEEIWIRNGVRVNAMNKHAKSGGDIFTQCLPLCVISPSSVIIHHDLFNTIGRFDEQLPACEDYDLWLRICARHAAHYLTTPLIIKYGGHDDQLSAKYWGMDRFRIQSLHNLITSNTLDPDQRLHAINMLIKKAHVYIKGATKRGKTRDAAHYQALIDYHAQHADDTRANTLFAFATDSAGADITQGIIQKANPS